MLEVISLSRILIFQPEWSVAYVLHNTREHKTDKAS